MFDDDYEVVLADTAESLREHFRLRYLVYCLEHGYEDRRQFPDAQERDAHDSHSSHFLVRCKRTGRWVATLRLVLPETGVLPIQRHGVLDNNTDRLITEGVVAEVSRVCHYRGDLGHRRLNEGPRRRNPRPDEPGVMFGLMRAAFFYCLERDIEHLLFLIRPAMARLVGRMSIPLRSAGQGCDHRGTRYPYAADLRAAFATVAQDAPDVAAQLRPVLAYRRHSEITRAHELPLLMAS